MDPNHNANMQRSYQSHPNELDLAGPLFLRASHFYFDTHNASLPIYSLIQGRKTDPESEEEWDEEEFEDEDDDLEDLEEWEEEDDWDDDEEWDEEEWEEDDGFDEEDEDTLDWDGLADWN